MITTLTRIGDDYALIIDQAILDRLRITPDTPLEFSIAGEVLRVTPIAGSGEEPLPTLDA